MIQVIVPIPDASTPDYVTSGYSGDYICLATINFMKEMHTDPVFNASASAYLISEYLSNYELGHTGPAAGPATFATYYAAGSPTEHCPPPPPVADPSAANGMAGTFLLQLALGAGGPVQNWAFPTAHAFDADSTTVAWETPFWISMVAMPAACDHLDVLLSPSSSDADTGL